MGNPLPYIVSYSFSGFQASNPATPLPAPQVDNELANIAAAIAAVGSFAGNVIRSDGALKSGIVTLDSFAQGLQLTVDPTNGNLVAAAVATAQAAQAASSGSATAAGTSATNAAASALAAATSAGSVNLTLFLPKAGNLAGLGSLVTSRANLGLGSVAIYDVGALAGNIVQLNGAAKIPAYDGSLLINIDTVPIGATIWVNDIVAPTGFIKENGALISRASFPRLAAYALASSNIVSDATWLAGNSGSFSTGDLATTFRLPDSRGEFIRAYDDSRGVDAGRVIGTRQVDLFKSHAHQIHGSSGAAGSLSVVIGTAGSFAVDETTALTGGSETRPRNIPKLACIKAIEGGLPPRTPRPSRRQPRGLAPPRRSTALHGRPSRTTAARRGGRRHSDTTIRPAWLWTFWATRPRTL